MQEKPLAVIFDMDGVIVDNITYHFDSWQQFCSAHGFSLSEEELTRYVNGRVAREVLEYLFKRPLSAEEVHRYTEEKEEIYRKLYRPHLQATTGLIPFLQELQAHHVPIAVATSAPATNIDFTLEGAGVKAYFQTIVDARHVKKGKPDPEIYRKAADQGNGVNAILVGPFHGFNQIRRITANTHGQYQVAGTGKVHQLAGKHFFVSIIVA